MHAIAVDSAGNAYLAGATNDSNFPATPGAYQPTLASSTPIDDAPLTDAFLAKLAPDASRMVWATYLGGESSDAAQSIAVDPMNSSGAAILYAGRYPNQTVGQAVALDPATGLVHMAGPTGLVSATTPAQAPTMRVFGLVSMAGGETSGRITGGEMVSIYGPHVGPPVAVIGTADSSGSLPTMLGGVQVSLDGANAPLLYVSDSRIDAILPVLVPHAIVADNARRPRLLPPQQSLTATLQIINSGTTSPAFPVVRESALPVVFRNPDGSATALNQDGSVNSYSNPAKTGSVVTIWATGTGYLPAAAGVITTSANNSCALSCQINVYGSVVPGPFAQQATVVYAGASPGFASGFTEIVFRIPPNDSFLNFNLSVNGFASDPVRLYVTNQ